MNPQALCCRTPRVSRNLSRNPPRRASAAAALLLGLCLALSAGASPQKPERHSGLGQPGGPAMHAQGAMHSQGKPIAQGKPGTQAKSGNQGKSGSQGNTGHSGNPGAGISPQQAVSIAKQRQQGQVLSVKRTNGTYQVKMLHQGQVRYVNVAAD